MFALSQPQHDPMLTNASADDLMRMVDADLNASPRERALAEYASWVPGLQEELEAAQEATHKEEQRVTELQTELEAAHEAGNAFRRMLREVWECLHESQQEEVTAVLAEFPSEEEKDAEELARVEKQRLWRIRSAHGVTAASLMGKPAVFEFRGYRKRTWQRGVVVQNLTEADLLEMEKYRMRRGPEVSEARWVSP